MSGFVPSTLKLLYLKAFGAFEQVALQGRPVLLGQFSVRTVALITSIWALLLERSS